MHLSIWVQLGARYEAGESDTPGDIQLDAIKCYGIGARQGDAVAMMQLGRCYENGVGVTQDILRAVVCYCQAARQGNMEAVVRLGWCYQAGIGVAENRERAIKCYSYAAERGCSIAMVSLGLLHEGVDADFAEACYEQAMEQILLDAQSPLTELSVSKFCLALDVAGLGVLHRRIFDMSKTERNARLRHMMLKAQKMLNFQGILREITQPHVAIVQLVGYEHSKENSHDVALHFISESAEKNGRLLLERNGVLNYAMSKHGWIRDKKKEKNLKLIAESKSFTIFVVTEEELHRKYIYDPSKNDIACLRGCLYQFGKAERSQIVGMFVANLVAANPARPITIIFGDNHIEEIKEAVKFFLRRISYSGRVEYVEYRSDMPAELLQRLKCLQAKNDSGSDSEDMMDLNMDFGSFPLSFFETDMEMGEKTTSIGFINTDNVTVSDCMGIDTSPSSLPFADMSDELTESSGNHLNYVAQTAEELKDTGYAAILNSISEIEFSPSMEQFYERLMRNNVDGGNDLNSVADDDEDFSLDLENRNSRDPNRVVLAMRDPSLRDSVFASPAALFGRSPMQAAAPAPIPAPPPLSLDEDTDSSVVEIPSHSPTH